MKNILKESLLTLITTSVLLVSCSTDEEAPVKTGQANKVEINKEGETLEQLRAKGYEIFEEQKFDGNNILPTTNNVPAARQSETSLVTYDDLKDIDPAYVDEDGMRNRVTWVFGFLYGYDTGGRRVEGVGINDIFLGTGTNPNNTQPWKVYKSFERKLANRTVENGGVMWRQIPGTYTELIDNRTDSYKIQDDYRGTTTITDSNAKKVYIGYEAKVKIGGKIGIPLVTEGNIEFSVKLIQGWEDIVTRTVSITPRYPYLRIPPHSRAILTLLESHATVRSTWAVPIRLTGLVGADWGPNKFLGHHFIAADAKHVFYETTDGDRKYTLNVAEETAKVLRYAVRYVAI